MATEMGFHYKNVSSNQGQEQVNSCLPDISTQMYTSTSQSVYWRLTLLSFFFNILVIHSLSLAAQKCESLPSHFAHSTVIQIPPSVTSLTAMSCSPSSQLLTLAPVPVKSCLDYRFISYFVHIQSIFYTIAVIM